MDAKTPDHTQWMAVLRHRGGLALVLFAVVALGLIAAAGGFRRADASDAAWTASAAPGRQPSGKRYLVLRLRAENLTDSAFAASALLQQDIVWLADGRSDERKAQPMQRADDHTLGVILQPELPSVVDFVWEIPPGQTLRQPVTWGVYGRRYQERGYLQGDGDAGWRQGDPLFKLVLDAVDTPAGPEA
jgi:hypothetical protein